MAAITEMEYKEFLVAFFVAVGHREWVRLSQIYKAAASHFANKLNVRNGKGIKVHGMQGAIRRTLQHYCSARPHFLGKEDLFLNKHGWWALR